MKQLLRTLPLFILSLFVFSAPVSAFFIQSGDNLSLPKDKTYNETVIVAGNTLVIDSTITGDLICAGQNITINGAIKGSVICAGQDIKINGPVDGNVRIVGQQLTTNTIKGDLLAAGQTINLFSTINRDVLAIFRNITLDPKTNIVGNFDYYVNQSSEASIAATVVKGKITKHLLSEYKASPAEVHQDKQAFSAMGKIISILSVLIIGLFILLVFKPTITLDNSAIKLFFLGFAVIFLTPIFIVILFMTIIGIPLAFILFLLYVLGFFVAIPLASIAIGRLVQPNLYISLLIGSILFGLLSLLPLIGWFFGLIFLCLGFGLYLQSLISIHTHD